MGQTIEQRRMARYLKDCCFQPPDVDITAMIRYLRSKEVTYSVMADVSGLCESSIRHFANPEKKVPRPLTGKTMQNGYRLINMLLQIKRAVDKPGA